MGDGALAPTRSGLGARFRLGHGARQAAYGDWKASLFANIDVSRSTNAGGAVFHDLQPLPELAELRRAVYLGGKKVFGHDYLKQLTPLSLAIWYMDDGSFALRAKGLQERTRDGSGRSDICIEAMEPSTRARLVDYLADTWGIRPKLMPARGQGGARLPQGRDGQAARPDRPVRASLDAVQAAAALPGPVRGRAELHADALRADAACPSSPSGRKPPSRATHRFDIEVEGSHNYLADGVVVHNSPETTSGGRALKFYASVRLDVRRIEALKDGPEVVGNRTRAKVVKNKLAPPFRSAEFDIIYGQGISKEGSLLDVGVDVGLIKKSGAWFTYDGDQLGQGRENSRNFLRDNPELAREIEEKIKAQLGVGLPPAPAPAPSPEPDLDPGKPTTKDQDKL